MAMQTRPPIARRRAPRPLRPMPSPTEPSRDGLTVLETAERTGLSEHTLRYYERAGLLTAVRRDGSSGHRHGGSPASVPARPEPRPEPEEFP